MISTPCTPLILLIEQNSATHPSIPVLRTTRSVSPRHSRTVSFLHGVFHSCVNIHVPIINRSSKIVRVQLKSVSPSAKTSYLSSHTWYRPIFPGELHWIPSRSTKFPSMPRKTVLSQLEAPHLCHWPSVMYNCTFASSTDEFLPSKS